MMTTEKVEQHANNKKKRDYSSPSNSYYRHGLIRSPLRKHIKAVHDSACGNATCTTTKEPFPLLLPPSLSRRNRVTGGGGGGGGGGGDGGGGGGGRGVDHLALLGALTGGIPVAAETTSKFSRNGDCVGNGDGEDEGGAKRRGDEALDLLTSAAFLFKTSRRNLF
jgi:hypothetical protein